MGPQDNSRCRMRPLGHPIVCFVCLVAAIAGAAMEARAVDVTLQVATVVPITGPTALTVTLASSPSPEPVVLAIRCIDGTGEAVFLPGRQSQVTVTQTTTLELVGTTLSNWEDNLLLTATVQGQVVAATRVTVVDPRMLPRSGAIELTRPFAISVRKPRPERRAPVTVELQGTDYVVTFYRFDSTIDHDPPMLDAGGFHSRYILDAVTGVIREERLW